MNKIGKILLLIYAVVLFGTSAFAQDYTYNVIEYTVPSHSISLREINNNGDILGYNYTTQSVFIYSDNNFIDVVQTSHQNMDMNNNGDVVGNGNSVGAFVYSNGSFTTLPDPPIYAESYLTEVELSAINDNGIIAGEYGEYDNWGLYTQMAFLYDGSSYTNIIGSDLGAFVHDINNNNQVIVNVADRYGYIYDAGTLTQITQPGAFGLIPYAINDSGDVAGLLLYNDDYTLPTGFFYSNGSVSEIMPLGWTSAYLRDINNSGQMIGSGRNGDDIERGFLYYDGTYTEIMPDGWQSSTVSTINDNGDIIGYGRDGSGVYRSFVASVVPEPVSSLLFVAGGTLLAGRRIIRRKKNERADR